MSKYVDIEALGVGPCNRDVFNAPEYADGWNSLYKMLQDAPAADVRPERYAEWEQVSEKAPKYVCTGCQHLYNNREYKYCPFCGAKIVYNVRFSRRR